MEDIQCYITVNHRDPVPREAQIPERLVETQVEAAASAQFCGTKCAKFLLGM